MAKKDYFCKDCKHNKNGWCAKLSKQGLKDIKFCNDKFIEWQEIEEEKEFDSESYKQFGKREMFYHIQMQMLGIDKEELEVEKFKTLKQVMVNLEKMLQINEGIFGIATDYMIDQDIIDKSKAISNYWLKEVGGYKDGK